MTQPRVLILRAPGTNCDGETAFAFEQAGARSDVVHVNRLLEDPRLPQAYQILCLPGGFSYGDDIAAGRIFGNQIRQHLADTMRRFKDDGKLILGICNGFQILMKSGLLLDDLPDGGSPATLTANSSGKFEDRWIELAVCGRRSAFLMGIESMYLPVAHAEGRFVARAEADLDALEAADGDIGGQLALRYRAPARLSRLREACLSTAGAFADSAHPAIGSGGDGAVSYPHNPNGSQRDVAGVCDATGRVLGLMPHPERYIDRTHHPRWTRGEGPASGSAKGDGLQLFENAVAFFE